MQKIFIIVGCALLGVAHSHPGHSVEAELAQHFGGARRSTGGPSTNEVSISVVGDFRIIRANGIPDHQPGQFPNRNNPNTIEPQQYEFRVSTKPKATAHPISLFMQPFGVAVNGVVFDPFAAEWWNDERGSKWQYEPMNMEGRLGADANNAHVQPNGAYHYHSIPTGLIEKLSGGKERMVLVGWAADGFPIYGPFAYQDPKNTNSRLKKLKSSYRIKKGTRPDGPGGTYDGTFVADYEFVKGSGDLDECNGRFGFTSEFPRGTYYYVLTDDFPFIPRFFRGIPDDSFKRKGPPQRRGPGGTPPQGGPRPDDAPGRASLTAPDSKLSSQVSENTLALSKQQTIPAFAARSAGKK